MQKILIVVDMQNDFIDGSLGTKEAASIVPNVCSKIARFDGIIFVTMDTHYVNYLETNEGKHLPVSHCIKGSDGWKLSYDVKNALREKDYEIIEKNSFGSIILPQKIKEKIKDESIALEIIGLCTDICVVSNALILKASFPEASIKIYTDCCAGTTVKAHNDALNTMKMCQIDIL